MKIFCKESSMHGLKNVITDIESFERNSTKSHKVIQSFSLTIWIVACVLSVIFGLILTHLVYVRYHTKPTITTIETNNFGIWKVHFPAVTICDINKVHRRSAEPIIQMLVDMGLNRTRVMKFFSHLSKLVVPEFMDDVFSQTLEKLKLANYTTERLMFEVQRPCDDMIQKCFWRGVNVPCKDIFRVSTSLEGFCCSFNYKPSLNPKKIDTDRDYIEDTNFSTYREFGAGPSAGLEALIDVSEDDYYSYGQKIYGVSVYVHATDSFPLPADKVLVAQPATDVLMAVKPTVLGSSSDIRGLPLFKRKCFFKNERPLRAVLKYTYQSCISECTLNATYRTCNCIPYFYPDIHLKGYYKQIRQCTLEDVNCLRKNQNIFNSLQPNDVNEILGLTCDECLPNCSDQLYAIHAITSFRSSNDTLKSLDHPDIDLSHYIQLKVHYKDLSCIKYRRDIFMTWDAMFASIGGIFSLCLGGSVISLVEFLYFFIFKLMKNIVRQPYNVYKAKPIHQNRGPGLRKKLRFRKGFILHSNSVNIKR